MPWRSLRDVVLGHAGVVASPAGARPAALPPDVCVRNFNWYGEADGVCVVPDGSKIKVWDETSRSWPGAFTDYYVIGISTPFRLSDAVSNDGYLTSFEPWSPVWKFRVYSRVQPPPSTEAVCSNWATL